MKSPRPVMVETGFSPGGWLVAVYVLSLPLTMITLAGVGSFQRVVSTAVIGVALLIVLATRRRLMLARGTGYWVLYSGWTLATVLWAASPGEAMTTALGLALVAGTSVALSLLPLRDGDAKLISGAWLVMGGLCAGLFFIQGAEMEQYTRRSAIALSSGGSDPNEFCAYFFLPLALLVATATGSRSRILKLGAVLGIVTIFYMILLTGSRGGLLGAVSVLSVVALRQAGRGLRATLATSALVVLIGWMTVSFIVPTLPPELLTRLSVEALTSDGGSGRVDVWAQGIGSLGQDDEALFFGVGPLGAATVRPVLHNHYLQALVDGGLIGWLFFLGLAGTALRNAWRAGGVLFGATVGALVTLFTLTGYANYRPVWAILAMTLVASNCRRSGAERTGRAIGSTYTPRPRSRSSVLEESGSSQSNV